MTNRTKIINANSLHTVESLRRWASCCFSQPVSRMLATVLKWLTDFLTGAIMESQKAARSKAVASPRCARQSRKHEFEQGFELKNSTSLLYLPISSSVETWKIFRNMLCQFFFSWTDILSEKNPYFGKHLFCKTKTDYAYKLRVQDFATGKNFSFNQCSKQESFAFFSRESYFMKAIENYFPVFAYPDINTRGVGRILASYANPRLCLGFA